MAEDGSAFTGCGGDEERAEGHLDAPSYPLALILAKIPCEAPGLTREQINGHIREENKKRGKKAVGMAHTMLKAILHKEVEKGTLLKTGEGVKGSPEKFYKAPGDLKECVAFLESLLANDGMPKNDVKREADKSGFNDHTLMVAYEKLWRDQRLVVVGDQKDIWFLFKNPITRHALDDASASEADLD